MKDQQTIGGISFCDVIAFQTQIMMGAQFKRVMKGREKDDIAIACLRMGWNDAFRHTSVNVKNGDKSVLEQESEKWNKIHKESHDDFICGNILNQPILLEAFKAFAQAPSSKQKAEVIEERFGALQNLFAPYKALEGERKLSFGHFQKMFNMALKLYLCLYMCRGELGLSEDRFDPAVRGGLEYADCPIDSIILGALDKQTGKKFSDHKWSKFGAEEYLPVQKEIGALTEGKSNLSYDFHNWE